MKGYGQIFINTKKRKIIAKIHSSDFQIFQWLSKINSNLRKSLELFLKKLWKLFPYIFYDAK